jgi:hypothetical protein
MTMTDAFRYDSSTMGTPFVNARATARYVGQMLAAGCAPLVTTPARGTALVVQRTFDPYDLDEIELGERASYALSADCS